MEGGKSENYVAAMKEYGALYPYTDYGVRFMVALFFFPVVKVNGDSMVPILSGRYGA